MIAVCVAMEKDMVRADEGNAGTRPLCVVGPGVMAFVVQSWCHIGINMVVTIRFD
jgi:hypothetical protein